MTEIDYDVHLASLPYALALWSRIPLDLSFVSRMDSAIYGSNTVNIRSRLPFLDRQDLFRSAAIMKVQLPAKVSPITGPAPLDLGEAKLFGDNFVGRRQIVRPKEHPVFWVGSCIVQLIKHRDAVVLADC
jgi:hypothetical protein